MDHQEIHSIEIGRPPQEGSERRRSHVTRIHDLIRRGAGSLGLAVVEGEGEERKNSAAYRGNPVTHLRDLASVIPGLNLPETLGFDEWLQAGSPTNFVAKDTNQAHGKGKYLLETPEQVAQLKRWVAGEAKARGVVPENYGYEQFTAGGLKAKRESDVRTGWAFQRFVDCPGGRLTAFRVIATCTGATLAGQLMYSHPKDGRPVTIQDRLPSFDAPRPNWWSEASRDDAYKHDVYIARKDFPTADLEIPKGDLYLGSRAIAANRMFRLITGQELESKGNLYDPKGNRYDPKSDTRRNFVEPIGGRIVLGGTPLSHPISHEEAAILEAHGLDPVRPRIPEEMEAQSQAIARYLGVRDGVIKGLWFASDWVQDEEGRAQLMEVNYRPDMGALQDHMGGMDIVNDFGAQQEALRRSFEDLAKRLRP